ncbi:HAMP domain-containing sensor histidine kinase [Bacillus xiapuensis]|uniref:histidine kinase n=1 Tax=Bacillus xiapuensis TaxID=2014075 RepID=A0ABU6NDX4_9BACI|nr:HAMP domain-containing sensor histidine kinase [Bacillus xiapuensis]
MQFEYINHNVLDNLFYIIVSILIFFVIYDNVQRLKKYKQILLTAFMGWQIILCMKFPIYIDQYCVHDLRQIPLFIGTLYGGWPTGAALLIILLTSRFAIYGFNFLTLMVYIVIFLVTAVFSTKFNRFNKKKKLLTSALITFILEVITTYMAVAMSDVFKVTEAYIFYFIIVPPLVVFLSVYLLELLMDTIRVRSNMVKLEKMEVVSQLAASISHEVRNPLTVVKGFIELLKDPELSQEKKEQYIEHVARELNNAEAIISDYLAFAKPATEKVETIIVEQEMKNIIEILRPWANMKSVNIKERLVHGTVLGNANYFRQCFLNIMKNGIEAMPNGGELQIATILNKNDFIIKVSDTGVGMNKEQINRYGEPYYSSKEKGTGLGSMVAVKTIQTMRGKLEIESAPDEGTTITVFLPIYLEKKVEAKIILETEFLRP